MKKILYILLLSLSLGAVELKIAKGSYDVDFSILDFMKHSSSYDTTVLKVEVPRVDIGGKIFYYLDLDYHFSDTSKKISYFNTQFANYQAPLFGSLNENLNSAIKMNPFDGDCETLGFDFNFGLGYDLVKKGNSYLALAINSGATLPNVSAKNFKQRIEYAYKIIKKWDLDVGEYKIGPSLRAKYAFSESITLFSNIGFGFQKAFIESDLFRSDVDSKGRYTLFDISLSFKPDIIDKSLSKKLSFEIGHSYKKWSVDSVEVNLFDFFHQDIMRPFSLDLKSSYTYLGIKYNF